MLFLNVSRLIQIPTLTFITPLSLSHQSVPHWVQWPGSMVSAPGSEDLGRGAISDATPSQVKVTLNTQLTVWKSGPDTLLEPEEWSSFSIEGAAMDSLRRYFQPRVPFVHPLAGHKN